MQADIETVFYIILILLISIAMVKIGEILGQKLAKKQVQEEFDFKSDLEKRVNEWREKRGEEL